MASPEEVLKGRMNMSERAKVTANEQVKRNKNSNKFREEATNLFIYKQKASSLLA